MISTSATPRKSAVAIVLSRGEGGERLVLVGRRSRRTRFLGGFHAFPGGAHEPEDGKIAVEGEEVCLRRTASRELREETGVVVAAEDFLPGGRRITPPFALRRFDSLMLVAELDSPARIEPEDPGELEDLGWVDPRDLVERWRRLEIRLAPPVIPILVELAREPSRGAEESAARLAEVNASMEDDGPRIEFVPDVLMLTLETPTLPPATTTNCYLVGSGQQVIIDPGSANAAEQARLARHVRRRADEGVQPRCIVVTHHHGDHTGGAAALSAELGVPVLAHPATWSTWGSATVPRGRREEIVDEDLLELSDGERLRFLHTPGHADGHLAVLEESRGSLFAGDLVSGVSTILLDGSPGCLDVYRSSLERIRDAGAKTLFPAHGPPMIDPVRAVQGVLDHREEREARILDAVRAGASTISEITRAAYEDTPGANPALAARQALCHLDRLVRRGRVRPEGGGWSPAA